MRPPSNALYSSHNSSEEPATGRFHSSPQFPDVPTTSRVWMASWEPLVHLVEESPGYFKTKGNIYSLLETKPHGDNTTANMM